MQKNGLRVWGKVMFSCTRFRGWVGIFLIPAWFLCMVSSAQAAIGQADQNHSQPLNIGLENDSSDTGAMRMVISLFLVLAFIAAGVFLMKKLTPYKGLTGSARNSIQVLSKVPLGQKTSICLVRIADEILVVGLTNTNMSLLSKMSADDYYQERNTEVHEAPAEYKHSFRKILDKIGINGRRT